MPDLKIRNHKIDFLKGLCIFLVIWGHCIQYLSVEQYFFDNLIFKIIYSFHMPLFMLISGYLYYFSLNGRTWAEIIKNKAANLGIPIFTWGIINLIIKVILSKTINLSVIYTSFVSIWFLCVLIIFSIVLCIIEKACNNPIVKLFLHIVCLFIMYFVPKLQDYNVFLYPYFLLGYYYNKHSTFFNKFKSSMIVWIWVVLWIVMLIFYNKNHYIYTTGVDPFVSDLGILPQIFIDIYRYAIGLAGCISVIFIVNLIHFSDRIINCIVSLGRITLEIYLMQRIFLELLLAKAFRYTADKIPAVCKLYDQNNIISNLIVLPLTAIIICIILSAFLKLINNTAILSKILFNKERKSPYGKKF